jgi:hypothetical protein
VRCAENGGSAVSLGLVVAALALTGLALLGCWIGGKRRRRAARRLLRQWRAQLEVVLPAWVVKLKLLWAMAQATTRANHTDGDDAHASRMLHSRVNAPRASRVLCPAGADAIARYGGLRRRVARLDAQGAGP